MLLQYRHQLAERHVVLASTSKGRQELFKQASIPVELTASDFPEDLCKSLPPIQYVVQTAAGKGTAVFEKLLFSIINPDIQNIRASIPDMIISADTMVVLNYHNHGNLTKLFEKSEQLPNQDELYEIIGKPTDHADAVRILTKLSRQIHHHIITGVCLLFPCQTGLVDELRSVLINTVQGYNDLIGTNVPSNAIPPVEISLNLLEITKIAEDTMSGNDANSLQNVLNTINIQNNYTWVKCTFNATTRVTFQHNISPQAIQAYVDTNEPLGKAGGYAIQGAGASFIQHIVGNQDNVIGFPIAQFSSLMDKIVSFWSTKKPKK